MHSFEPYRGFEMGPIRPPSEAASLLLRIARNCPWNKCKFCGLYKGKTFSIRPLDHVRQDIQTIRRYIDDFQKVSEGDRELGQKLMAGYAALPSGDKLAFQCALQWFQAGMNAVFLQDADALTMKPDQMVELLQLIRQAFPQVERITSYARSRTLARLSDDDLARMARAGLDRIHVGMESGADEVLRLVNKGSDKKTHIAAGQKVKRAGMELSEYYMPGLGGMRYWREHARQTADAMNQIDPDFIRIRTLALPDRADLSGEFQEGVFLRSGDVAVAGELHLFLENLYGISSTVKSDHILNLLPEVEGRLPEDKDRMTAPLREFLALPPETQMDYIVGRRAGVLNTLEDMYDPILRQQAAVMRASLQVTLENVDNFAAERMKRFI